MTKANQLSFHTFQKINKLRNNEAYITVDSSDLFFGTAIAGEVGELCNFIKKERRDKTDFSQEIAEECADIIAYISVFAEKRGIDLGQAVTDKFNEVSRRKEVNSRFLLSEDGASIIVRDLED